MPSLWSGLFYSVLPTETVNPFLLSLMRVTCPTNLSLIWSRYWYLFIDTNKILSLSEVREEHGKKRGRLLSEVVTYPAYAHRYVKRHGRMTGAQPRVLAGSRVAHQDRLFWFSSVTPNIFRNNTPQLSHDHFLPHPLQFIFHLFIWCLFSVTLSLLHQDANHHLSIL
jgi:hypothetical protein